MKNLTKNQLTSAVVANVIRMEMANLLYSTTAGVNPRDNVDPTATVEKRLIHSFLKSSTILMSSFVGELEFTGMELPTIDEYKEVIIPYFESKTDLEAGQIMSAGIANLIDKYTIHLDNGFVDLPTSSTYVN